MNMLNHKKSVNKTDDVNLVLTSLGGDRESFCEIVARYQNLLCSLAFASIGDIKQSEDLAQEVFIEAWQKLDTLREPEKLKSWLCGILRFKISRHLRKEKNQPAKGAEDIDEQILTDFANPSLENAAIDRQQQALLWNTLSNIDITYREPLILFYRQQQSVERVADELDLTIDTAKQRLSRGRKLLKEAMLGFVGNTLDKSKPGVAFTVGVAAMLNDITKSAAAATLGVSSLKTTSVFKFATLITALASFSGLISLFFGFKASLYQSRTENERRLTYKVVGLYISFTIIWVVSMYGLKYTAINDPSSALFYALTAHAFVFMFVLSYFWLTFTALSQIRNLRAQERIFQPEAFTREIDQRNARAREYKSALRLFGIPLIHFQFGTPELGEPAAIGWISGGSKAYGVIFAWGLIAAAPISVGVISIGIFTIGAVGIGLFSLGAVAIGIFAFGASAIGYKAYAALSSLGWESAFSDGFSIAKDAAVGIFGYANEINNEIAYEISNMSLFNQSYQWILSAMTLFVIVPAYLHFKSVRKRMKKDSVK
jgi:RNA polymerase sigma factor (sigma-70 family)